MLLALSWLNGCAVYDSSLLTESGASPLTDGAGATNTAPDSGAGAVGALAGGDGGDSQSIGGVANQAGSDPLGPDSAGAGAAGEDAVPQAGSSGRGASGGAAGGSVSSGAGAGGVVGGSGATAGAGGNTMAGPGGNATPHELALGQPAVASSFQAGNLAAKGNDGDGATRWCAVNDTLPQWWRVDLGALHALRGFSVQFEHADRKYGYTIETSPDDKVYTLQATLSGMAAVQSSDFPPGQSGRYVRITVTSTMPVVDATGTHIPWASFSEFSITGI